MANETEEKTEEPTDKKLQDSAEEGQTYKFKELIYLFNIGAVFLSLYALNILGLIEVALVNLGDIEELKKYIAIAGPDIALAFIIPAVVAIFSLSLPSLMQTKFVMATKALKIDFDKLNPVNGVKNLFSMKTVIELFKAIVVHVVGIAFIVIWFLTLGRVIFEFMYVPQDSLSSALFDFTMIFVLLATLIIFISTTIFIFFEYRQHIKELKMTKQEVKRENKDQNGNPEIKTRRNEIHRSLISDKDEADVKKSSVILANPTHLAIGIYFDLETAPIPFVSVKHKGSQAMEVFRIAKENNIPIIRNKKLTRSVYKSNDRYTLILNENLIKVLYLLHWVQNIDYQLPMYDERDVDVW